MIPIRTLVIGIAFALALASSPLARSTGDEATRPALVIDFTGANDTNVLAHADEFAQAVLPEAPIMTIGMRGIVPDSARRSAGYSRIEPTGTAAQRANAAQQVHALTAAADRMLVGFDINEILPQQVRNLLHRLASASPGAHSLALRLVLRLSNKTQGPAEVAARSIALWKQQHPDGVVIIRGHSDGTWATLAVLEYLDRVGLAPDAVILESLRQQYPVWARMAQRMPRTSFLELGADKDLWVDGFVQRTPSPTHLPNCTQVIVKGEANAFTGHGAMTRYSVRRDLVLTDSTGTRTLHGTSIGQVVRQQLSPLVVTGAKDMLRRDVSPRTTEAVPPAQASAVAAELRQLRHGLPICPSTSALQNNCSTSCVPSQSRRHRMNGSPFTAARWPSPSAGSTRWPAWGATIILAG